MAAIGLQERLRRSGQSPAASGFWRVLRQWGVSDEGMSAAMTARSAEKRWKAAAERESYREREEGGQRNSFAMAMAALFVMEFQTRSYKMDTGKQI